MPKPHKKVLLFTASGYEDLEGSYPLIRLREAGFNVTTVGIEKKSPVLGKHGYPMQVDKQADEIDPSDFSGCVIPGGMAPEALRLNPAVIDIVQDLNERRLPIGAICHGPQVLISAELTKDRRMTCWKGIRDDLENAGAEFVDASSVLDDNVVTARNPDDLAPFMKAFIEILRELNK